MWRIAATLVVVVTLVVVNGSTAVNGQTQCSFVGRFATLRDLVGPQTVGACLEDERVNVENGNSEQRTTAGLLVWRKADDVAAFTDGVTTWLNGPNGLESRPNGTRLAWETDDTPSTGAASMISPPPSAGPISRFEPSSQVPGASGSPAASPAALSSPAASPDIAGSPAADGAPASGAQPQAVQAATPTPIPSPSTTPTKTPNPAEAKFVEKPDVVDTGNELRVKVKTNMKKGACSLIVDYNNSPETNYGGVEIDNGECEWKVLLATDVKTGTAKVKVAVSGDLGTVTIDDEFRVRKGDAQHVGDPNVGLDLEDAPDEVRVGDVVKITINTDQKRKNGCIATVAWPHGLPGAQETKTPDDDGKCSWKFTVPTTITKQGEATLTITVRGKTSKGQDTNRTVTKKFDVKV